MRFSNQLPADATLDDNSFFARHCYQSYRDQKWHGDSISEYFTEKFQHVSVDDLIAVDSDTRRNIQDILCQRAVFVPRGRILTIENALHQVVQNITMAE